MRYADLHECLPEFVTQALEQALPILDKKLPGFAHGDALLTAVESRSSAPVRIPRDENYESNIQGVFPCGEGAGYAGGILSAERTGCAAQKKFWRKIFRFFGFMRHCLHGARRSSLLPMSISHIMGGVYIR